MTIIVVSEARTLNTDDRFKDDLTSQDVFDFVAYHLGTMPERSVGATNACMYRSPNGNSCAVGHMIKDIEYKKVMEGTSITTILYTDVCSFLYRLQPHRHILIALQGIHDARANWENDRKRMRAKLETEADFFHLNTSILGHPDMAWNKVVS